LGARRGLDTQDGTEGKNRRAERLLHIVLRMTDLSSIGKKATDASYHWTHEGPE